MPGEKLSRKQEQAIAALLMEGSIKDAAAVAEVAERTLRMWLGQEGFAREYRKARRQVVEAAVGTLQAACGKAIRTMVALLDADNLTVRLNAAKAVYDYSQQGVTRSELIERVEELERRAKEPHHADSAATSSDQVGAAPGAAPADLQPAAAQAPGGSHAAHERGRPDAGPVAAGPSLIDCVASPAALFSTER